MKQKVTLSLDSEIYQRTRDALTKIPGKPSVSSLVDELLDSFAKTVVPSLALFASGEIDYNRAHGQMTSDAFSDFIRTFSEELEEPDTSKK